MIYELTVLNNYLVLRVYIILIVDLFLSITLIIKFSFISMFMRIIKHNLVNKLFMLVFGEIKN
jgi:hypothetical protein